MSETTMVHTAAAGSSNTTSSNKNSSSNNKTMLMLWSGQSPCRDVVGHQTLAFTILQARGIPHATLDGAWPENKNRRNELFEISGLGAKYPQFFVVSGGNDESTTTYWGNWDDFENANEQGILAAEFAPQESSSPSPSPPPPPSCPPEPSDAATSTDETDDIEKEIVTLEEVNVVPAESSSSAQEPEQEEGNKDSIDTVEAAATIAKQEDETEEVAVALQNVALSPPSPALTMCH
jgi:hypothetical protein